MNEQRKPLATIIAGLAAAYLLQSAPISAQDTHVAEHVFSIEDLQVDFQGKTFGPGGTAQDQTAICGLDSAYFPDSPACPYDGPQPLADKEGITLYPVDNAFGFHVVDFIGAEEKVQDGIFTEGFVGNIEDGGEVIGIKVSNAETDTYKVEPPLGTWCQGLGGTSIKCSTEHYSVMEHVLTCNELIPYFYYDFDAGQQATLSLGEDTLNCADRSLDNLLLILVDGEPTGGQLTDSTPGVQMDANDNTTVLRDIATGSDYSLTLKDDGKALYRWGSLIKRPNDIRLYARMELPAEWKVRDADGELMEFPVHDAKLYVTHWITNNPNDQLRPEDLENEAATGRKPSYTEEDGDIWKSLKDCYEGDGDVLEGTEGTPIAAGTYFRNGPFALDDTATDPYAFSSDLTGAFTNGYYTTVDRDPFEWSYVDPDEADAGTHEFVGSPVPLVDPAAQGLELVSGPRWRLKSNKFGQDIPGLEIPLIECSVPPYGHDNIKYEVGTPVTTVINLLDWDEEGTGAESPLSTSKGWVEMNDFVEEGDSTLGLVTTNGLPMTEDFDLAVYIKGDRKPTALYSAKLVINGEDVEPPISPDYTLDKPKAPNYIYTGKESSVEVWVNASDNAQAIADGSVLFIGTSDDGYLLVEIVDFGALEPGEKTKVKIPWTAPDSAQTVDWTMWLIVNGSAIDRTDPISTVVREK